MILAIDVQYTENNACIAGVLFESWTSQKPFKMQVTLVDGVADYEPGQFYKRELPCILALLNEIEEPLDYIVVDGYVWLGCASHKGLGGHLFDALNKAMPIIGVAKKAFKDTSEVCAVYRGKSAKPLYVTTAGVDLEKAKKWISSMNGAHREPVLLKKADQLCRGIILPS